MWRNSACFAHVFDRTSSSVAQPLVSLIAFLLYYCRGTFDYSSLKNELTSNSINKTIQNNIGMASKLGTVKKLKDLIKKYWYIALPVHIGTSGLWYGSLFGATKAGLDFVPLLEKTSLPEKYVEPLKKGNLGNYAQALVLYKIIAPIRYASSLYVARSTVRYLRQRGLVK